MSPTLSFGKNGAPAALLEPACPHGGFFPHVRHTQLDRAEDSPALTGEPALTVEPGGGKENEPPMNADERG